MKFSNYKNHLLKNVFQYYFWEPFNINYSHKQESFKGLIKLILHSTFQSITHWQSIRKTNIPELSQPIAFGPAHENKDVLSNLKILIPLRHIEILNNTVLKSDDSKNVLFGYLGLYYAFHHIYWYFFLKGYERTAYRNKIWHCFYGLGRYRYIYIQLKKSKNVKCFVGVNDLLDTHQMGFIAAGKLGIKTVYIQHASVTEKFPPLRVDLALLDGYDAAQKYRVEKCRDVKIRLIGSPKYDIALESRHLRIVSSTIGVCVNIDNGTHPSLFRLCENLEELRKPFIIRFHPNVEHKARLPFLKMNWLISDVLRESEIDFIFKCSTIISSDSNILLDALILYRRPLYFSTGTNLNDYYGFLKNKLIDKKYTALEDVLKALESADYDINKYRNRAKRYVDTINTPFEGESSVLALIEIFSLLGEPLPDEVWNKHEKTLSQYFEGSKDVTKDQFD